VTQPGDEDGDAIAAAGIAGIRIVVASLGTDLGPGVAADLARAGARVALVGDRGAADGGPSVACTFTSREETATGFAAAVGGLGGLDSVVQVTVGPGALEPAVLVQVDERAWDDAFEASLLASLFSLQAAYAHLRERGGRVVVVVPTLAFTGAAGLAAFSGAGAGQRLLAKSAARQWGRDGIAVNCVATSPEMFRRDWPEAARATFLRMTRMGSIDSGPTICAGSDLDSAEDVLPAIKFLAGATSGRLTGQTLVGDGGTWMVP
jgi:NAD(P)-dependent dehydrogenase (short-subunit alcohol dehydrogenase family)